MDVTLQTSEFIREMELLEKIASRKPTIAILSNVLLSADAGGGARLVATDIEVGLVTTCPAEVPEPGITTLSAKRLLDMLRLLQGPQVQLTLDTNGSVRLRCGNYNARLQTAPPADFPKLPSMRDLPTVLLPQSTLRTMISRVQFAVSDKDKRYFINGALVSLLDGSFKLVSTDGHRLCLATATWECTAQEPFIIPVSTLVKLAEMLTGEEDVVFAQSDKHLFFLVNGRLLVSRMIDGKFPAFERIIPKGDDKCSMEVDRMALRAAVQRVLITAGDSFIVVLHLAGPELTITSKSQGIGDAVETLAINATGAERTIALNGQYLLDFLNAATSANVTMHQKTQDGALLFRDGEEYCYIQMPVRL
ncbi:MAG: DNA polymerase III subunit beta [Bryobacteraceae bacterium]